MKDFLPVSNPRHYIVLGQIVTKGSKPAILTTSESFISISHSTVEASRKHSKQAKRTIKEVEDYPNNGAKMTIAAVIELEGSERPACIAEFVGLMFE